MEFNHAQKISCPYYIGRSWTKPFIQKNILSRIIASNKTDIREFKPNGQTMVASPEYGSNGEEPLQFFAAIAKKDIMPSAFFLFSAFPGWYSPRRFCYKGQ